MFFIIYFFVMLKVVVGKSEIDGTGLLAKRDIKKGEIVFIMKGKVITLNSHNQKRILADENIMGIEKDKWISPRFPYVYINHSCSPNTSIRGRVTFVAIKDIKKDEEVTFDYSISEDSTWKMNCNCGSKHCRKIIRSVKYLPSGLFRKYFPVFPSYFKKIYLQEHQELRLLGVKN